MVPENIRIQNIYYLPLSGRDDLKALREGFLFYAFSLEFPGLSDWSSGFHPIFEHDEKGKLYISELRTKQDKLLTLKPDGTRRIDLSLSHKNTGICVAFSADGKPIGIDLEELKPHNPKIRKRFFTKAEQEYVSSAPSVAAQANAALDSNAQDAAFFEIWTKKEAYVKLLGTGFSGGSPETVDAIALEQDHVCRFNCITCNEALANDSFSSSDTTPLSNHIITLCTPYHPEYTVSPVLKHVSADDLRSFESTRLK